MIVQSAQIQLAHQHHKSQVSAKTETLLAQTKATDAGEENNRRLLMSESQQTRLEERSVSQFAASSNVGNPAQLSNRGRAMAAELAEQEDRSGSMMGFFRAREDEEDEGSSLDAETYQLKAIVESFTGREIHLHHLDKDEKSEGSINTTGSSDAVSQEENKADLIFQYKEHYEEQESSLLQVSGDITLQSGQTIQLDMEYLQERYFYQEASLEIVIGEIELKDPLVVNLQGASAQLSEQTYRFDLDADGQNEEINFATGGSGFLALDQNHNGKVDDGSELFGALTGNGFAELASYDEDSNGFIDSGDSVFEQLLFVQKDASGVTQSDYIQELGIGALYLGNTHSPFDIKNADNELQAKVRTSGFFLNENGSTGTLQQIDLVI